MRETLILPEGYGIQDTGEDLRLYGPQGVLLQEVRRSQAAADALAAWAWREAWGEVERDLADEIRALRQGHRSLSSLKRLRQYYRMLDALERPPDNAHAQVHRSRMVAGLALVASAAAMTVMLLATQPWRASPGQPSPHGRPTSARPAVASRPASRVAAPAAATSAHHRAPDRTRLTAPRDRASRAVLPRRPARAPGALAARGPVRRYVVSFGEFASRAAAEVSMRLIRSRGYVVHIMHSGGSYHVATGPRERAAAERLAAALQEIGLPARAQPIGTPQM